MKNSIKKLLHGSVDPINAFTTLKFRHDFAKNNPDYFYPDGLLIFCGAQGNGKTLSAVQYVRKVCRAYPKAILCTNVAISGLPEETQVVEYDGISCLKNLENGQYGVIYLIDEIHLEFNSLESKNIDIDVMIEISQQRKQRKHIVGTSQIYGRMAKPLREQVKNVVLCRNYFGFIQVNQLIDGEKTEEKDGKLCVESCGYYIWLHTPELYGSYDTYAKMKRYKKEWKGRKRVDYFG